MGVTGLWAELFAAAVQEKTHLVLRGSRVGVDISMNMVRALVRLDAADLAAADYSAALASVTDFFFWLRSSGATVVAVFDGEALPGKAGTHEVRGEKRAAAKARCDAARVAGTTPSCSDLKASMGMPDAFVNAVLDVMRTEGFYTVTAPYEADAQLLKLAADGLLDCVISDDGDLLRCVSPKVSLLRHVRTDCVEVEVYKHAMLTSPIPGLGKNQPPILKLLQKWGIGILVWVGLLAGCDYVKVAGWGMGRAKLALAKLKKPKTKEGGVELERPTIESVLSAMEKVHVIPADTKALLKGGRWSRRGLGNGGAGWAWRRMLSHSCQWQRRCGGYGGRRRVKTTSVGNNLQSIK